MKRIQHAARSAQERGYALISLLAAMTLVALALGAAVEPISHRAQRDKEEEMLWRGAQVAEAINKYYQMRGAQFPTSLPTKLEDLTAEYNFNGKKVYLVRRSAMHDPMTGEGEWKPVRVGDPLVADLYRAYIKYATGRRPPLQIPQILQQAAAMSDVRIESKDAPNSDSHSDGQSLQPGSAFSLNPESRPIIGVVSRSKAKLIRNYFGLESYDRALFFPGVQLPGGMVIFPVGGSIAGAASQGVTAPSKIVPGRCPPESTDPTCPRNRL